MHMLDIVPHSTDFRFITASSLSSFLSLYNHPYQGTQTVSSCLLAFSVVLLEAFVLHLWRLGGAAHLLLKLRISTIIVVI